jgi:hypothetical protein
VIVDWLSVKGARVRSLEPDDLIQLSKAGASDALVQKLLELSAGATAPVPPTATPEPTLDPPGAPNDGLAGLALTLHYKSQMDSAEERNKRWTMFAYLDGRPVAWSLSSKQPVKTALRIAPGRHVIHLMRESHREKKKSWRHDSLVGLTPIEFTVEAGEGWHLMVDWIVPTFDFSFKGPLSWSLTRWSVGVAAERKIGEPLEDWPKLCDDMEANAPPGKTPGWVKRDLVGCARWSTVWEDVPNAPDRDTVRGDLEAVGFRPSL